MTSIPNGHDLEDAGALERKVRESLQIVVNRYNLHDSDSCWRPEMEKLAEQVVEEIDQRLKTLPEVEEVLVAEIHGFPGISKTEEPQSSSEMGTSNIRRLMCSEIVKKLVLRGIIAEVGHDKTSEPRQSDTQIMIRQWNDHEPDSYALDVDPRSAGATFSYQKSKLQYFVRKVKPKEIPDPSSANVDTSHATLTGHSIRDRLRRWWLGR